MKEKKNPSKGRKTPVHKELKNVIIRSYNDPLIKQPVAVLLPGNMSDEEVATYMQDRIKVVEAPKL